MKKLFSVLVATSLTATLGLTACGTSEPASTDTPVPEATESAVETTNGEAATETAPIGAAWGYAGTDPVEAAVYQHMAEVVSADYDKADASIPIVQIVHVDDANPDGITVYGDFWINNYDIEGETLACVSGGDYPGVMHLAKDGDGYVVTSFDVVADGSDFDASARELFGEHYDAFMQIYSNDDARAELRKEIVSDYVRLNGLEVTQYQDYGWDPVKL